jgi:hypothetical protein
MLGFDAGKDPDEDVDKRAPFRTALAFAHAPALVHLCVVSVR